MERVWQKERTETGSELWRGHGKRKGQKLEVNYGEGVVKGKERNWK